MIMSESFISWTQGDDKMSYCKALCCELKMKLER